MLRTLGLSTKAIFSRSFSSLNTGQVPIHAVKYKSKEYLEIQLSNIMNHMIDLNNLLNTALANRNETAVKLINVELKKTEIKLKEAEIEACDDPIKVKQLKFELIKDKCEFEIAEIKDMIMASNDIIDVKRKMVDIQIKKVEIKLKEAEIEACDDPIKVKQLRFELIMDKCKLDIAEVKDMRIKVSTTIHVKLLHVRLKEIEIKVKEAEIEVCDDPIISQQHQNSLVKLKKELEMLENELYFISSQQPTTYTSDFHDYFVLDNWKADIYTFDKSLSDNDEFTKYIGDFMQGERPDPTLSGVDIFTKLADDQFMVITPVEDLNGLPIPTGVYSPNMVITSFQQVGLQLMAYQLLSQSIKVNHKDTLRELLPALSNPTLSKDIFAPVYGRDPKFAYRVLNTGTSGIGKSTTLFVVALLLTNISDKIKVNIPIVLRDQQDKCHYFSGLDDRISFSVSYDKAFEHPTIKSCLNYNTPNSVFIFDTDNKKDFDSTDHMYKIPNCPSLYCTSISNILLIKRLTNRDIMPIHKMEFFVPSYPPINDNVMRNILPWLMNGHFADYVDSSEPTTAESITATYNDRLSKRGLNIHQLCVNDSDYKSLTQYIVDLTLQKPSNLRTSYQLAEFTFLRIAEMVHTCENSSQLLNILVYGRQFPFRAVLLDNDYVDTSVAAALSIMKRKNMIEEAVHLVNRLPLSKLDTLYKYEFYAPFMSSLSSREFSYRDNNDSQQ